MRVFKAEIKSVLKKKENAAAHLLHLQPVKLFVIRKVLLLLQLLGQNRKLKQK